MEAHTRRYRCTLLAGLILASLSACGGHKVLKEPEPMPLATPSLGTVHDARVAASLDWVIVRDGPGTWARDADWDQYLMTIANTSDAVVAIDSATVYDSLEFAAAAASDRKTLVRASRQTVKRYKGEGLKVKAGMGAGTVLVAGAAIGVGAVSAGTAMAAVGAGSAAGVGAVLVGLLAAPVLIGGGVVKGVNSSKVSTQIEARHTALPLVLQPGESIQTVFFFPLSPSPRRVALAYEFRGEVVTLVVDTAEVLDGLHVGAAGDEKGK
jgi:hypothetical protein